MKFDKLFFRHEDAVALGSADKAIILEFIRWSCHFKEASQNNSEFAARYFFDGVWWMQDSYEAWRQRLPWLSVRTIRRYLEEIYEAGFMDKRVCGGEGNGREPNFYRIRDIANGQIDQGGLKANLTIAKGQSDQGLKAKLATTSLSKNHSKNRTKESRVVFSRPEDMELGQKWLDFALKVKEGNAYSSWTVENFARELAKVKRRTGFGDKKMEDILAFVEKNEFWAKNAISPAALLTISKNNMRKIDNIVTAMKGAINDSAKRGPEKQRTGEQGYELEFDIKQLG